MNREGGQGLLGVGLTGRILQYQIELKIFIKFTLYREKTWEQGICISTFRERRLLQERAKRPSARSPTNNRQSVKAVRTELSQLKEHTPMRQESDARPPDSSPEPPGPEASSKEARAAGLPPLPDVVLAPPPPSLLSGRAGGPVRLRESHHSLHRYCNIACMGQTVE